jgi:poly [ADP-ribose] polymerase
MLDCALRPLSPDSPAYSLIQTYVKNSNCCGRKQDRLQLVGVFAVDKRDQQRRYEPFRVKTNRRVGVMTH